MKRKVILYGHDGCPGTERARRYFRDHAIPFVDRDLAQRRWLEEIKEHGVFVTPFLLVGHRRMIGFDEAKFERLWAEGS